MMSRLNVWLVLLIIFALAGCHGGGGGSGIQASPFSDPPVSFQYEQPVVSYVTGQAIPANVPLVSGGSITQYSIAPALPDGLSLDPSTGVISGTPTSLSSWNDYVVTGLTSGASVQTGLRIRVVDAVQPVLSLGYSEKTAAYTAGTAIDENRPHPQGGAVSQYSVSPSLPPGLAFSTSTGIIGGTPTEPSGAAAYTVTGFAQGIPLTDPHNPSNATEQLTISVADAVVVPPAPSNLAYAHPWAVYGQGEVIEPNVAFHDGGDVDHYTVQPPLPAGMRIDPSNGDIVGAPSTLTSNCPDATCTYEVVASGPGGSASTQVRIEVAARRSWVPTPGAMAQPRYGFAQVALPDGRILVAGGIADPNNVTQTILNSAELYDPNTGTFTSAGTMVSARYGAMAQLLPNGKVLIAGGFGPGGVLAEAELFDPSLAGAADGASPWQATGAMASARSGASIALTNSGKVVVAGGTGGGSQVLQSSEIYDPQSGAWTAGARLQRSVAYASALAMQDGAQIVIPGGRDNQGNVSSLAQVATDPAVKWTNLRLSANGVRAQYGSFIVSPTEALIFGGINGGFASLGSIDRYDATTSTWSAFPGQLVVPRSAPLVAPLDGNGILIAGGLQGAASGVGTAVAETLNLAAPMGVPANLATASMNFVRIGGGISALPDGSVLVVGGWDNANYNPGKAWSNAEIYVP